MIMAADVVRGDANRADLDARLAMDLEASEVRTKTAGILNRIWFPSDEGRQRLVAAAANYAARNLPDSGSAPFLAVTTAAYPFFGEVVETVGRLIIIQGSCTAGEVHRRMFERHGQSRTISLAGARVFRTLVDWGLLSRAPNKRLQPLAPISLSGDGLALLNQGANIYRGSVTRLASSDPLLFAFQR